MLDPLKILTYDETAIAIARKSKDRSHRVSAIAFGSGYNILSTGWNGFPRGVNDDIATRHKKPTKYFFTVHAEANVICNAARSGSCTDNSTVFVVDRFCCANCAGLLINAGVKQIVVPNMQGVQSVNSIWDEHFKYAMEMFEEVGMHIDYYDLRVLRGIDTLNGPTGR